MNVFVIIYLIGGEPKYISLLFVQISMLNAMIISLIFCSECEEGDYTKTVEEEVYLEKVKKK